MVATIMGEQRAFVPSGFDPPTSLDTKWFWLRPLGPEHNEADHAAWISSIEHIRATPGFAGRSWPRPMTLEENLEDLRMHAAHFAAREGFTYTVLEPETREVMGCVYIYPSDDPAFDAHVRSWVRADRAHLDEPLAENVARWLAEAWPFRSIRYRAASDAD